ncbi:MAG: hypothetical protein ACOZBH_00275 [Patescibacteria group bacterium]
MFFIFFVSTVFFSSHYLTNWDAGQFALGTKNFDIGAHQPHPPGYFLYVYGAKALNFIFPNINTCFLIINFIAGALAIYFFYKLIFLISENQKISFFIGLLLTANPAFWYYHNIANTYVFEILAVCLAAFFTYKTILGDKNAFLFNAGAIALIMGFRPSIILLAAPLLLINIIFSKQKLKNLLLGAMIFAAVFAAWFIPFASIAGFHNILSATKSQASLSAGAFSKKSQLIFMAKSLLFCLNAAVIFFPFLIKQNIKFIAEKKLFYFLIPPAFLILFYSVVHFGEVGYGLGVIPIFLLFSILPISRMMEKLKDRLLIYLVLAAQVCIFIWPLPAFDDQKIFKINYSSIKQTDSRIGNEVSLIAAQNPSLLIIILRGQYLDAANQVRSYPNDDIRILGYYLPGGKLYDFAGVIFEYSIIENYTSEKFHANCISIPPDTSNILILADYLNPIDYPDEFELTESRIPDSGQVYYTGSIENIDKFEFKGFYFNK